MSDVSISPLMGLRVAITRPLHQSGELEMLLVNSGATVLKFPPIAISPRAKEEIIEDLARFSMISIERGEGVVRYDWVIFTSANAVDAMFKAGLPPVKIAAIGQSTAKSLASYSIAVDLVPDEFVTSSLIKSLDKALGPDLSGLRILLPRGDLAKKDLPKELRLRGAQVDELIVYSTVPDPTVDKLCSAVYNNEVDIITFSSSSAVRFFAEKIAQSSEFLSSDLWSKTNRPRVFVIGPVTYQTAISCGIPVDGVAADYDSKGLVTSIIETIKRTSATCMK